MSALAEGPLSSEITATDVGGATETVQDPGLTIETSASLISFSEETDGLSIDIENGTYAEAAKVLLVGDSPTILPAAVSCCQLQMGLAD